jgi:phosphatidyl-myo-inositol dimannoside synthase
VRTLWLTNDFPPEVGGIERFVAELVRRTDPAQALVLAPSTPGAAGFDGGEPFDVERLPVGTVLPDPGTLRRVHEAGRRHEPDVVVLGATWPLGELSRRLAQDPGVPVVSLTHGLEAGLATAGLGALLRRATRGAAAVTAISAYTEARIRPHVGDAALARVPPGVDTAAFVPGGDGRRLRRSWGIPEGAPVLGCVSRLVRRKGQDVLLEAWTRVREQVPRAWLVIAGGGPLEGRLGRRAPDAVVMTGAVPAADLPDVYAAFDAFAMPCRTRLRGLDVEGLGMVFLEAQACGIPVIAGRSGGAPETVREGQTGLVVDGREPARVAEAAVALLEDRERRGDMGRAGRAWVEERWSWDVVGARFRSVLEAAARGCAPRPGRGP